MANDSDLDWIAICCLEKDRACRYESASHLAADLQRHLNHEVVVARPPSTSYRIRRMVRRHRVALGAATAVVVALVFGLGLATWEWFQEHAAHHEAEAAGALAEQKTLQVAASLAREQQLRHAAEDREQEIRLNLYTANVELASRQASDPAASLVSVEHLLAPWRDNRPDLRGWEWYYLSGLSHRDRLTIPAGGDEWAVAWSPDGASLAAPGKISAVAVWNARSGESVENFDSHSGRVLCVAWSPDSRYLASGSTDNTLTIWPIDRKGEAVICHGHTKKVMGVAWSPDGKTLASCSDDGTVRLWNPSTGAELQTWTAGSGVTMLSWDPTGSRVAGTSLLKGVIVWDVATGGELFHFSAGPEPGDLRALAWSPDGRWIATGGNNFRVMVWDVATRTSRVVGSHQGAVWAVAWNRDGTRLASASPTDWNIKIWDVAAGKQLQSMRGHLNSPRAVAWSPDGSQVVSSASDGTLKVWAVDQNDPSMAVFHLSGGINLLAWNADSQSLAAGSKNKTVWIQDFARPSSEPVLLAGEHTDEVRSVAWSPDGTRVASAGWDGVLAVWDRATARKVWSVQGHPTVAPVPATGEIGAMCWNPDGNRIATVGVDGTVKIWTAENGTCVASTVIRGIAYALAWSPDGTQLAVGSVNDIRLLDGTTAKTGRTLLGHTNTVRSLAWSRDGRRLASASDDDEAKVWDPVTGMVLLDLIGHGAAVHSVAWNPDGSRLITGSWDSTARIWNAATGQVTAAFEMKPGKIEAVAWSPDGRKIAYGDISGNIRVHDASPGYAQGKTEAPIQRQ